MLIPNGLLNLVVFLVTSLGCIRTKQPLVVLAEPETARASPQVLVTATGLFMLLGLKPRPQPQPSATRPTTGIITSSLCFGLFWCLDCFRLSLLLREPFFKGLLAFKKLGSRQNEKQYSLVLLKPWGSMKQDTKVIWHDDEPMFTCSCTSQPLGWPRACPRCAPSPPGGRGGGGRGGGEPLPSLSHPRPAGPLTSPQPWQSHRRFTTGTGLLLDRRSPAGSRRPLAPPVKETARRSRAELSRGATSRTDFWGGGWPRHLLFLLRAVSHYKSPQLLPCSGVMGCFGHRDTVVAVTWAPWQCQGTPPRKPPGKPPKKPLGIRVI